MARPRILPDADELHQLRVVEGKTYAEIAEKFGVTKEAVRLALTQARLTKPRPRYAEEIPWVVAIEHSNDYRLSMLRTAARLEHGLPVPEYKARYVRNWIENLKRPRPDAPNGVVIDYDRDFYAEGFAYVPRESGDEWLIRRPSDEST